MTEIYIGNLPYGITSGDLEEMFAECGNVVKATVASLPGGRSKGYGVIGFSSKEEALHAIEEFHGAVLDGRTIEVRFDKGPTSKLKPEKRTSIPLKANAKEFKPAGGSFPASSSTSSAGGKTLFIGNLAWSVEWAALESLLREVGTVTTGEILFDHQGRSKGFAIVTMASEADALAVIGLFRETLTFVERYKGYELDSRKMEVRFDKGPVTKSVPGPKTKTEGERLVVYNLPSDTQWQALKDLFKPFGVVLRADVQANEDSCIGFVVLAKTAVDDAIVELNGSQFNGNEITVEVDTGKIAVQQSLSSGVSVYIGNLPFQVRWQDLKDLFKDEFNPIRADVIMEGPNRSKGFGIVRFATIEEAQKVVEEFQGATLQGREIVVRLDKFQ